MAGLVEYIGPANDIVLNANPETGEVSIYHLSAHLDPVDITSYSIISANGSLQPDAWTSLSDGGDAAWTEANPPEMKIRRELSGVGTDSALWAASYDIHLIRKTK